MRGTAKERNDTQKLKTEVSEFCVSNLSSLFYRSVEQVAGDALNAFIWAMWTRPM